ncbi:MAG: hypothetical protein BWK76_01235 [Desulfobulbaceae bacterium A2]|nr:MAG: hypothetical protein BWK76_01235 [Desulfobulbaceae bacterium A2]
MAGADRAATPDIGLDLKLSLLKEGHAYAFFQAVRLLRYAVAHEHQADDMREEGATLPQLRILPNLSLAFPAADIEKIEELATETRSRFQMTVNFFGLYGVASPLPTFYTEDLLDQVDTDLRAGKDFLDIIHQRLYALLYHAWLKYRLFLQVNEERASEHLTRLFCLLGLGEPILREGMEQPEQLLRYLGLFAHTTRSALGLKTLLEDALQLPVEILPCLPRKARIPVDQRIRLGGGPPLGEDSFLGEEMDDRMGKFRLQVGPLNEQEYRAFIPGSTKYNRLVFMTNLYVLDPLDYDIDVTMAASQARTTCLGHPQWSCLGRDTWLFSGETMGATTSRFYPGQETRQ